MPFSVRFMDQIKFNYFPIYKQMILNSINIIC